jgi:hypothetical protein
MSNKTLMYLGLAALAGYYIGHYLVEPTATTTTKGTMRPSTASRLLGIARAAHAPPERAQHLSPRSIAYLQRYGVMAENQPWGVDLVPREQADSLFRDAGKILAHRRSMSSAPYNLAD